MARKKTSGVEEQIAEAISEFRVNVALPRFLDMAGCLERNLMPGESLVVQHHAPSSVGDNDSACVYVKSKGILEEHPAISLDCEGTINYQTKYSEYF